jgi:hypothetical protein
VRSRNKKLLNEIKALSCQVCGKMPVDPCHIRSVGAGGVDVEWNLLPMCRKHHSEQHNKGWIPMLAKYPMLELHLRCLGWQIVDVLGRQKIWHPKLGKEEA